MRTSTMTGVLEASDNFEGLLDDPYHGGEVWPRIGQPDLRLHREGVAALLHDG